jgi:hypothetical protein
MLEKGYWKGLDGNDRLICDCGGTRDGLWGKWLGGMEIWLKRMEEQRPLMVTQIFVLCYSGMFCKGR